MRWCVPLVLVFNLNSLAQAEALSPWFGSQASAPVQLNVFNNDQQIIDSTEVSAMDIETICPIEGCPSDENFGKQPK